MKRKNYLFIIIFITLITLLFISLYPSIEFYNDGYLYMMSYGKEWDNSEDFKELEEKTCYDESYSYNKKRDISISSWDYNSFLFFKWFKVEYQKGNICATEFILEESYIKNFLENAKINKESDKVDIETLIKGKEAIISNKRYPWNENHMWISYVLDGKYEEMFIYTNDEGLIIIQVGLSDEGAKYIAYK